MDAGMCNMQSNYKCARHEDGQLATVTNECPLHAQEDSIMTRWLGHTHTLQAIFHSQSTSTLKVTDTRMIMVSVGCLVECQVATHHQCQSSGTRYRTPLLMEQVMQL